MESIQDLFEFEYDLTQFETDALENLERFINIKNILEYYCDHDFKQKYDQIAVSKNVDSQTGVSNIDPQQPYEIGYAQIKLIREELFSIKKNAQDISKELFIKMIKFSKLNTLLINPKNDFNFFQELENYQQQLMNLDSSFDVNSQQSKSFNYYKCSISSRIYKIIKEPYIFSYFTEKIPFLDDFIRQLLIFLYQIHNDYINRNDMTEYKKLRSDFLENKENKKPIPFENYKQIKDLIMKSIYYYDCIKYLIQIRNFLEIITYATSSIKFYLEKSGFLELIQGKFSKEDFSMNNLIQKSNVKTLFINYSLDDIFQVIDFCASLENYYIQTEIVSVPDIIAKIPYNDDFLDLTFKFKITDNEINFLNLFSQNGKRSLCFSSKQVFSKRFEEAINFGKQVRFHQKQDQKVQEKKPRKFGQNK